MVKKLDKKTLSSMTAASLLLGGLAGTAQAAPLQGFDVLGNTSQVRAALMSVVTSETPSQLKGDDGKCCEEGKLGEEGKGGEEGKCGEEGSCGEK